MFDKEKSQDEAKASRALQPFELVRRRLRSIGHLPAADNNESSVIILASYRDGEGVTTLCRGLAMACSVAGMGPTLAISHAEHLPVNSSDPASLSDNIVLTPAPYADEMSTRALRLTTTSTPSFGPRAAVEKLRASHKLVFIDGGTLDDDTFIDFRSSATKSLLVVDLTRSNRRSLSALQHDISQMKNGFDGFIGNRFQEALPSAFQNLAP